MISHLEVVKQLMRKAGFLKEIAEVVALNLRKSTACLYHEKWFRFHHWCHGRNKVIFLHARPLF